MEKKDNIKKGNIIVNNNDGNHFLSVHMCLMLFQMLLYA